MEKTPGKNKIDKTNQKTHGHRKPIGDDYPYEPDDSMDPAIDGYIITEDNLNTNNPNQLNVTITVPGNYNVSPDLTNQNGMQDPGGSNIWIIHLYALGNVGIPAQNVTLPTFTIPGAPDFFNIVLYEGSEVGSSIKKGTHIIPAGTQGIGKRDKMKMIINVKYLPISKEWSQLAPPIDYTISNKKATRVVDQNADFYISKPEKQADSFTINCNGKYHLRIYNDNNGHTVDGFQVICIFAKPISEGQNNSDTPLKVQIMPQINIVNIKIYEVDDKGKNCILASTAIFMLANKLSYRNAIFSTK